MTRFIRRAALVLLPLLLGARAVAAQVKQSGEKVDSATGEPRARTPRAPSLIWSAEAPITVTLTANLKQLRRDRKDSVPWRAATLDWTAEDGTRRTIPLRVRTRGIWRRKNCDLPPLRLNFAGKSTEGTPFARLDKPKLVGYCQNTDYHDQYVLQELQLYRIYTLLTPLSHRVRLLRMTYVDSATAKPRTTRWAFLLEEPDELAARVGGVPVTLQGAGPNDVDPYSSALVGVFQFLIGNTDWSIAALHNAELVGRDGSYHPVAYDFDYAGAVNTTYAVPDPSLQIRHVRERLFRGYCAPDAEYEKVFALFNERREAIYALYRDEVGRLLDAGTVRRTLAYFDDFYRIINDRGDARRAIMDRCLGKR